MSFTRRLPANCLAESRGLDHLRRTLRRCVRHNAARKPGRAGSGRSPANCIRVRPAPFRRPHRGWPVAGAGLRGQFLAGVAAQGGDRDIHLALVSEVVAVERREVGSGAGGVGGVGVGKGMRGGEPSCGGQHHQSVLNQRRRRRGRLLRRCSRAKARTARPPARAGDGSGVIASEMSSQRPGRSQIVSISVGSAVGVGGCGGGARTWNGVESASRRPDVDGEGAGHYNCTSDASAVTGAFSSAGDVPGVELLFLLADLRAFNE